MLHQTRLERDTGLPTITGSPTRQLHSGEESHINTVVYHPGSAATPSLFTHSVHSQAELFLTLSQEGESGCLLSAKGGAEHALLDSLVRVSLN